ncbi:MAG: hypothetical protein Ct9H90mP14_3690 [Methanobacteriota archaeon]|nr:MAG: hypothetical protein Ct9H90mP14_3690 [Euryarchaeota archaeon]
MPMFVWGGAFVQFVDETSTSIGHVRPCSAAVQFVQRKGSSTERLQVIPTEGEVAKFNGEVVAF